MRPLQSTEDARADLTAQIDDLLNTLSNKFAGVSSEIFAKSQSPPLCASSALYVLWALTRTVDEMSRRLDNIETSIKSKEDASKS